MNFDEWLYLHWPNTLSFAANTASYVATHTTTLKDTSALNRALDAVRVAVDNAQDPTQAVVWALREARAVHDLEAVSRLEEVRDTMNHLKGLYETR